MTALLTKKGPPLDDALVVKLEEAIGHRLPDDYRSFLLETNGGVPVPNGVVVRGWPDGSTDVQVLFGVNRTYEASRIEWCYSILVAHVGNDVLPIARDSIGNFFVMHLVGARRGAIEFVDVGDDYRTYLVVASINDLLDSLVVIDDEA
jgi:hypothetical protein